MQKEYFTKHGTPMLLNYVNIELVKKVRLVIENGTWVCVVPYWARWPYETMLIPKRHIQRMTDLSDDEQLGKSFNLFGLVGDFWVPVPSFNDRGICFRFG